MTIKEARLFVGRFVSGDYTPEEHGAFLKWLEEASFDELDSVAAEYEGRHENWVLGEAPSSDWVDQLETKLDNADRKKREAPVRRIGWTRRLRWVAAASVVGLTGLVFFWNYHKTGLAPGVTEQPATALSNTVVVPKGSQRQIVLADGSKVWLNSASTLHYPERFGGKERVVELSGEAYFEIASNASMPFEVKVRDMEIQVLGTRFNVRAYEDESTSKTSLMEGSVKVIKGDDRVTLRPNELAEVSHLSAPEGKAIHVSSGLDVTAALAWKNGYLYFDQARLQTVMNEVARCYNVEIKYEGKIPQKTFSGRFARTGDLNEILKALESQNVHSRINGKIISVMP